MELSLEQRNWLEQIAAEMQESLGSVVRADGHAKTFDELEDECVAMGDWLTAKILEKRMAGRPMGEDAPACPECQRPGERRVEDEVRLMQTTRGEVAWLEATWFCRRCRRSFFPSVG